MENVKREPLLSVVVVGMDVEAWVRPCLESVRRSCSTANVSAEVIYVDSASLDNTVNIARPLADRVLVRKTRKPPFAGRLLGLRASRGSFVQFLDADMVVNEPWFGYALQVVQAQNLDMLSGAMTDARSAPGNPRPADPPSNSSGPTSPIDPRALKGADHGALLVRRSAAVQLGGHLPSLLGIEHSELVLRFISAGKAVAKTPFWAVTHMRPRRGESLLVAARRKWRQEYPGAGQAFRLALGGPAVYRRALMDRALVPVSVFAAGLIFALALVSLPGLSPWTVTLAAVCLAAVFAAQWVLKGTMMAGASSVADILGNALGIPAGFWRPMPRGDAYVEAVEGEPSG